MMTLTGRNSQKSTQVYDCIGYIVTVEHFSTSTVFTRVQGASNFLPKNSGECWVKFDLNQRTFGRPRRARKISRERYIRNQDKTKTILAYWDVQDMPMFSHFLERSIACSQIDSIQNRKRNMCLLRWTAPNWQDQRYSRPSRLDRTQD